MLLKRITLLIIAAAFAAMASACSPEVGSKEWCEDLRAKPKGDWSANEAMDFTKHCIF
tara:strand:+ start:159 stop:332 length:174 start_codon:yes stop_codon:yes gene_type:complete